MTGLSLLLLLKDSGYDLTKVAVVDPHFDGGDLARKWTTVMSNTPWSKTLGVITALAASSNLSSIQGRIQNMDASCTLVELAAAMRELTKGCLAATAQFQGLATHAEYSKADKLWKVAVHMSGEKVKEIQSRRLVLAQGSEPKSLHLPIPSIPLEIALDSSRLRSYVRPGERVVVFGTAHSGTLVVKNLVKDCSANVVNFYAGAQPFYWDRDGAYDGIKREAADIADSIVKGDACWGNGAYSLVPTDDMCELIRATKAADWAVYATGFSPRQSIQVSQDGLVKSALKYDGATGKLAEVSCAWGFGIAYPNRAPDGVHWDVSVAAFLEHMKRQLPQILCDFRNIL